MLDGNAAGDGGRASGAIHGAKVDVWSRGLRLRTAVGDLSGGARSTDNHRGLPAVVAILHVGWL